MPCAGSTLVDRNCSHRWTLLFYAIKRQKTPRETNSNWLSPAVVDTSFDNDEKDNCKLLLEGVICFVAKERKPVEIKKKHDLS
ncbi:hypothetical protein SUGI_0868210 [Cryptomeria japonica]|nr:hypothetical protein SUGI_0868210 [Cryptomeria japonica]